MGFVDLLWYTSELNSREICFKEILSEDVEVSCWRGSWKSYLYQLSSSFSGEFFLSRDYKRLTPKILVPSTDSHKNNNNFSVHSSYHFIPAALTILKMHLLWRFEYFRAAAATADLPLWQNPFSRCRYFLVVRPNILDNIFVCSKNGHKRPH